MGIASEVVYEVESVKTQSIPPIPQLLGVKKKTVRAQIRREDGFTGGWGGCRLMKMVCFRCGLSLGTRRADRELREMISGKSIANPSVLP